MKTRITILSLIVIVFSSCSTIHRGLKFVKAEKSINFQSKEYFDNTKCALQFSDVCQNSENQDSIGVSAEIIESVEVPKASSYPKEKDNTNQAKGITYKKMNYTLPVKRLSKSPAKQTYGKRISTQIEYFMDDALIIRMLIGLCFILGIVLFCAAWVTGSIGYLYCILALILIILALLVYAAFNGILLEVLFANLLMI